MEGNKLIAEFMGRSGKLCDTLYTFKGVSDLLEDDIWYTIEQSKFHTDWNWLMPVINKCYQEYMSKHIAEVVMTCDISKAYQVVVEFIKDYNQKP
jgi:hypothetical protein